MIDIKELTDSINKRIMPYVITVTHQKDEVTIELFDSLKWIKTLHRGNEQSVHIWLNAFLIGLEWKR